MAEAAPNPNASPTGPAGEDFSMSVPESWRTVAVVVPPAPPTTPAQRIALIENSQRCLTNGWLSLVPVAGALFVIPAVRLFLRVDRERAEWNPAAHLWLRGLVLACFGYSTNLLWWALGLRWAVDEPSQHNANDGIMQAYVTLFGSVPTLFGLAFAATRWPSVIGAFVFRHRWMLSGLTLVGYLILLQWLAVIQWRQTQSDPSGGWLEAGQPSIPIYWAMTCWLIWMLAGFVILVWRGLKSWWSAAWLAGAALLTLWLTAR